jgi:hypothetical protein
MAEKRVCSVDVCDKPIKTKNLCLAHYRRLLRHGDPLGGRPSSAPVGTLQAFVDEAAKTTSTDCVLWPFKSRDHGGYPVVKRGRRTVAVSRVLCEMVHGKPPVSGLQAAHSCGNKDCCNPWHIRWATQTENNRDCVRHGTIPRGESHHSSKLTIADVKEIRRLATLMPQNEIAARFAVAPQTICRIALRRTWKHVD